MEPQQPEPAAEAGARAAQLAAMSLSVAEALARLRAQRLIDQSLRRQRRGARQQAAVSAARATARRAWAPAMNRSWLRAASSHDLLRTWAAAAPWSPADPMATVATRRIEQRLHELHPELMRRYHQARARGERPDLAMGAAAAAFPQRPAIDIPRGDAALRRTSADLLATPAAGAGVAVIVGESFPTPIDHSLSTATRAAQAGPVSVTSLARPATSRPRSIGGPS
jgi:hypothetical protein